MRKAERRSKRKFLRRVRAGINDNAPKIERTAWEGLTRRPCETEVSEMLDAVFNRLREDNDRMEMQYAMMSATFGV